MLSDAVRRRLALLNRQPLDQSQLAPAAGTARARADRLPPPAARAAAISWLDRGQVVRNASGAHLRIRVPLAEAWRDGPGRIAGARRRLGSARPAEPLHAELAALASHFPARALFFDLETCGFAGSAVFLIGMLRSPQGQATLELAFARDYREERSMLEAFWQAAAESSVLVSFNGKCFDWPMVCDRSRLHRLEEPWPKLVHCDLLHHARRRWKQVLPNCKLQTLERVICRRHRAADIPGSQIPLAYHRFVRTGDAQPIRSILQHNALDLLTLLDLAMRITAAAP